MTVKRIVTIVVILAAVLAGSFFSYDILAQEKEPEAPDWETVLVQRATIVSTVSATGLIEPEASLILSFKGAGRVAEVLAEQGQTVAAGQTLARLEGAELDLTLAQAEVGLSLAKAQLSLVQVKPSDSDVAAAEALLHSAQTAYQEILNGAGDDELQVAQSTVDRARIIRDQSQTAYDQVAHLPNVAMLPQSLQLQQATLDYELAQANYRLTTRGASDAQKAAALAQVAQAQASLDRLTRGPSEANLEIARAQVRQAEVVKEQALLALSGTVLKAPQSGVISTVRVKQGELTSSAIPAFELTDLSGFHITVNVDEIDVGVVAPGQIVSINLDALTDIELSGQVASIAPTASLETGVISYRMRIDIDPSDAPLRAGMSATTSIVTAQSDDALVVPNRLVQIDREAGKAYVERIVNGVPVRTEIELGMRNDQSSEVVAGLEEGDFLVLPETSTLDRLRSTFTPQ